MPDSSRRKINIFVSYSHRDKEHLEILEKFLTPYRYINVNEDIDLWDDTRILASHDWRQEINDALARANVAILLFSPDFMASPFINEVEVPQLLEAAHRGTRIMPVILRACAFEDSAFAQFQAPHTEPLWKVEESKREEWWLRVASNINKALQSQRLQQEQQEKQVSLTLTALKKLVASSAPLWLKLLRKRFSRGRETTPEESRGGLWGNSEKLNYHFFQLDEKEQLRHLERVLSNATERGFATLHTRAEREGYKDIIRGIAQADPQGELLRSYSISLLSNFLEDTDGPLSLPSFSTALLGELYADPFFKPQLSDALQKQANAHAPQFLLDFVTSLAETGETLEDGYSAENFARDITTYTEYVERTLRRLKLVGVAPKNQNTDPELNGIFVQLRLRIGRQDQIMSIDEQFDPFVDVFKDSTDDPDAFREKSEVNPIVDALKHTSCLVLLGDPGAGKSTATKYLAWSHAVANQSHGALDHRVLLPGCPLPLRIELRRLNEELRMGDSDSLLFAVEMLLKREVNEINPRMFKELLIRRGMLLLFDGLDEVATLDDRLELVRKIERLATDYPGNYILVTSRSVGYDLNPFSHPLFPPATVLPFDDKQIELFLNNWYTHALGLSSLALREQEERDQLLTALREKPGLHELATNPLLLTVIASLNRRERLPDRRVNVYERCANLLLETGQRRRTDKRRTLQMTREQQYACVAYLGFVLHQRLQDEPENAYLIPEDRSGDVTEDFLLQTVQKFLKDRKLLAGAQERAVEARQFIALIQEDAGLIVKKGTSIHGEVYNFIHPTFREYFAAMHQYEPYIQKKAPISAFLSKHLYDPHWQEVILLLLGKLDSKAAAKQLRRILQNNSQIKRNKYAEIIHQNLFFTCECLLEGIVVENALAEMIVAGLCNVMKQSPFPAQRRKALEYLVRLAQTPQFANLGRKGLTSLLQDESVPGALDVLYELYLFASEHADELSQVLQSMKRLIQNSAIPFEQTLENINQCYKETIPDEFWYLIEDEPPSSHRFIVQAFLFLIERVHLELEPLLKVAQTLYEAMGSESKSKNPNTIGFDFFSKKLVLTQEQRGYIASIILSHMQNPQLPFRQKLQAAQILYQISPLESTEEAIATQTLFDLAQQPNIELEQRLQVIKALYYNSPDWSDQEEFAIRELSNLLNPTARNFEQRLQVAQDLFFISAERYRASWPDEDNYALTQDCQLALQSLSDCLLEPGISKEQRYQAAKALYEKSEHSYMRQSAIRALLALVQHEELPIEQRLPIADFLYQSNGLEPQEAETLSQYLLLALTQGPELPVFEQLQIATLVYNYYAPSRTSVFDTEEKVTTEQERQAAHLLLMLADAPGISLAQYLQATDSVYNNNSFDPDTQLLVSNMLLALRQRPGISVNQQFLLMLSLNKYSLDQSHEKFLAVQSLLTLAQHPDLCFAECFEHVKNIAFSTDPWGSYDEWAIKVLLILAHRPDLPTDQKLQAIEQLCRISSFYLNERFLSAHTLLTHYTELSFTQKLLAALSLYQLSSSPNQDSPFAKKDRAAQMLLELVESSDFSFEHYFQAIKNLYSPGAGESESKLLAVQMLLTIAQRNIDQIKNRDEVYEMLRDMVPQFHKLPDLGASSVKVAA